MIHPFNIALHDHLLSIGYAYERCPEEYYDSGNGETGPMVHGHAAYDQYTGDDDYVFCDVSGNTGIEPRDKQLEQWLDNQGDRT